MAKLKLTKGELKKQRDSLKQFQRYLPTLQLKKQQLQMKILEARKHLSARAHILDGVREEVESWSGLLADESVDIKTWVTPQEVRISTTNIAGANVPVFEDLIFADVIIDYYRMPFWVDSGLESLRKLVKLLAEVETIKVQIYVLEKELRVTTQRVNLFEKVKIPECRENIRKITIYLGDQQANAVGVSKVAKKKVEDREMPEPELAKTY